MHKDVWEPIRRETLGESGDNFAVFRGCGAQGWIRVNWEEVKGAQPFVREGCKHQLLGLLISFGCEFTGGVIGSWEGNGEDCVIDQEPLCLNIIFVRNISFDNKRWLHWVWQLGSWLR